jgi:hypothetical protein
MVFSSTYSPKTLAVTAKEIVGFIAAVPNYATVANIRLVCFNI